jgi:hypothetical protein
MTKNEGDDMLTSSRLLCSLGTLSFITLDRDATRSHPLMCSLSRCEEG